MPTLKNPKNPKPTRGGSRPGSGRKPGIKREQLTINIEAGTIALLGESTAKIIAQNAIAREMEYHGLKLDLFNACLVHH